MNKHKMKFSDWLVVTEDGKVGELVVKMWLTEELRWLYVANIPNDESEQTGYYEEEIDLVKKTDIPSNL